MSSVAAMRGKEFGLRHRIAQRLEATGADFLAVLEADLLLRDIAVLARHRRHLEAVAFEDAGEDIGVLDKADAVGDADLAVAHPLGEVDDLFHARPFAVTLGLDDG